MAYSQRLGLETVLTQMEEEFVSKEKVYEAFEDLETSVMTLASNGEAEMTALNSVVVMDC